MSRPIAHLAVYKLGAIAVPMSVLFGPGAIEHRLLDSEAKALILETDRMPSTEHVPAVAPINDRTGLRRGYQQPRFLETDRGCFRSLRSNRDVERSRCPDHLHVGHDGSTERGLAFPPGAHWSSPRLRALARLLSASG